MTNSFRAVSPDSSRHFAGTSVNCRVREVVSSGSPANGLTLTVYDSIDFETLDIEGTPPGELMFN
jgi:hypothetical protein